MHPDLLRSLARSRDDALRDEARLARLRHQLTPPRSALLAHWARHALGTVLLQSARRLLAERAELGVAGSWRHS